MGLLRAMKNEDEILRKYKSLRRTAERTFGPKLADDLTQDSILAILEGKNIKQRNSFSLIDSARRRGGSAYSRRGGSFEPSMPNAKGFNANNVCPERHRADNQSPERHRADLFNFVFLVSTLKRPREIQLMILHNTYEFTMLEISHYLGVSESRVSQMHTAAKERLKKVALSQGLSSSEQRVEQREKPSALSQEFKIIESLPSETLRDLEAIQRTQDEGKSELATRAFFKIPKAVFSFTRENKKENQTEKPRMAKIKLEGKSFICPKMATPTINFRTQKSN